MLDNEVIKAALGTQAEIDARIAEGLIPARPEGEAFAAWFDAHVGCSRCRYGVRVRGAMYCKRCQEATGLIGLDMNAPCPGLITITLPAQPDEVTDEMYLTAPWGALPTDAKDPNYGRSCARCSLPVRAGARYEHACPKAAAPAAKRTPRRL